MNNLFTSNFSSMKLFLRKILLFLIICSLQCFLCIVLYLYHYNIKLTSSTPAPNISDSYSFNHKMNFMRNKTAKILAIGSSMSMSNINSQVITEKFQTTSYLNYSSWGLNMFDIYRILKIVSKKQTPSTLIISSNIMDFYDNDKKFEQEVLSKFLTEKSTIKYHLTNLNINYYLDNLKQSRNYQNNENYQSLKYDQYGGIELNSNHFKIHKDRWNDSAISKDISEKKYSYLDSISHYCKGNKIKLLFFQSPFRKEIAQKINSTLLQNHIAKVKYILSKRKHDFIDATEIPWEDSLFVDATHFNSNGAKKYTKFCLDKIKIK